MIHTFSTPEMRWLSNFTPVPIHLDGMWYKSVEHAYMSAKFANPEWKLYCQVEESPGKVKRKSYDRMTIEPLVDNWEVVKLSVMRECLFKKFNLEPFKSKLLETGDQNIQEGNWHKDVFWGVDLHQTPNIGENHLGRIIMEIRTMLQYEQRGMGTSL